ncbi:hypothetical protein AMECASPLE_023830 [Ameca splendens]|uniref:Uncharacterized protein n=1 Tax=Ameca splendens TaxID=208324 RepID=A0ABV0YSB7_9TELE
MRTHKNTHTHTPNVNHTKMDVVHTYTPYTPEGQPAPGLRRWSPSFWGGNRQTSAGTAQNPNDHSLDPDPSSVRRCPKRPPSLSGGVNAQTRGLPVPSETVNRSRPRTNQS